MKRSGTASNGTVLWICKCECGNLIEVRGDSLKNGHSKTCGKCPRNSYDIRGKITIGKTTSGDFFVFDTKFLPIVKLYTWHMDERGCVITKIFRRKTLRLHTLIMGEIQGKQIDHKNNDPSDNRIENLRLVTQQQNSFNNSLRKDNKTGFKGVCFNRKANKYQAQIVLDGKIYYCGLFLTAREAGKAYNRKAEELFGEYAFLNDI